MSYYRTVWNDSLGRTQDLTCPEFLRLSEGPKMLVRKQEWPANIKFYYTLDLDTGKEYYLPASETRTLCGISYDGFRRKMNSKKKRNKTIKFRYLVHRVPKIVFIAKTNRRYLETKEYFYKY